MRAARYAEAKNRIAPPDETTSQSTKPASGQVVGYPANGWLRHNQRLGERCWLA